MKQLLKVLIIFVSMGMQAQMIDSIPRKSIEVNRIHNSPKVDGVLDDPAWKKATVASGFVERMPSNGSPIPDSLQTRVKIIYDELGIYFGAVMKDPSPHEIPRELTERDQIGNTDFFFILLNGYNDHQQGLEFIITAAGVQFDAKLTTSGEDVSWNAVWYSAVEVNESNWTAEVFIPYSELRFPRKEVQEWGLNMEREYRRSGSRYSWNHVDNKKGSFMLYDGEIQGIEIQKTPTRLSFRPYVSAYFNEYDGSTSSNFNGGMDLKYGINNAFTLDMILIPDFGQTRFDETVLNLSAFEVQYNENRPFFTEGTELFTKGGLFYSRRVGSAPSSYPDAQENEEVVILPGQVDLINASKISGRTENGLGIGLFNALTEKTYATLKNTETGETREELIEPFTNYNILVLDQRFNGNSSLSLVNTNTFREGSFRDANVTGLYADITNKKNTLNYQLSAEGSYVREERDKFGLEARAGIGKISGKHRIQGKVILRTKAYDIDDLGYTGPTNYVTYLGYYGYRFLQPKGFLNRLFLNFNFLLDRRLEPDLYSRFKFNFNSSFTTKEFLGFGTGFETTPFGSQDLYEPRVEGRHFDLPVHYRTWIWINTDYRKKLGLNAKVDWYKYDEKGRSILNLDLAPRYRISDQINLRWSSSFTHSEREEGYVTHSEDQIIFGQRNRNTFVNSFESQYILNNKTALNLTFRHYFSEVEYAQFYQLGTDGGLAFLPHYRENHNTTYNSWNLDLRFSWWFAPGSQLSLLYRNAIDNDLPLSGMNLSQNFENLFAEPQLNSISLRINYYLDSNRMKGWFGKKDRNIQQMDQGRSVLTSHGLP